MNAPAEGRTSEPCRLASIAALLGFFIDWWLAILGFGLMALWTAIFKVLTS
jgi:hypothetical protein